MGLFGTKLPRVPGHEIAGVVDAVGDAVTLWKVGDKVGVGWSGGVDFTCEYCRRGDFVNCDSRTITGTSFDGGYAEYMVAPEDAVARIPEGLTFAEASPLMCAGITAFNALRHAKAGPGDLVAVQGVGGVGHLAVQFANKMGFRTVAINRGRAKEELARQLGADEYIDSNEGSVGESLKKMGGASAILGTVDRAEMQSELINGIRPNGQVIVLEGQNVQRRGPRQRGHAELRRPARHPAGVRDVPAGEGRGGLPAHAEGQHPRGASDRGLTPWSESAPTFPGVGAFSHVRPAAARRRRAVSAGRARTARRDPGRNRPPPASSASA
ncbi:alcohol dehydrogenase catalytic domain-containing protein [Amycolatopsis carbonis]|uniref:alcohol dehydrogenase n=1 Tax=Amycolatopsis carbonis TaxID=715471 RepID=A0A9Y2INF2_9PSEU|nr:alcohol dehydrogenase catalytic domain-containing protein [Amycolatopsis sp. 2-15]WIX82350.1 alcohol dehydrogenase catalytic domain-containing protein [Amycolatopsis sp. 2-15]